MCIYSYWVNSVIAEAFEHSPELRKIPLDQTKDGQRRGSTLSSRNPVAPGDLPQFWHQPVSVAFYKTVSASLSS